MTSAFARALPDVRRPRSLAELAAQGISVDMTRSKRWRRSSRGFFVPAGTPDTPTQRIVDAAPLVPGTGAIAGWAAAYVLGVDLLDGKDPFTLEPLPVPIQLRQDLGRSSPAGVRFLRERLPATHRVVVHGLAVTNPQRTAFDGGRWASTLVEAVVFLDQVAHALELDLDVLQPWCVPGSRWPGNQAASPGACLG